MRLFYANPSPYARKVRVVIAEKGLGDRIEMTACDPFESGDALLAANPLSKIPALVLDDGTALYDSPVIAEYLDALSPDNPLLPASGPARWDILRRQALGDGMLDAGFAMVIEGRRPAQEQSEKWLGRWRAALERALDATEAEIGPSAPDTDIAGITLGCALGYLDFRLSDIDWRDGRPKTSIWYADFSERPSMTATAPG